MSIDTYDTQAIVRPGASAHYNLDWIERLAREVASSGGATVTRKPARPSGEMVCLSKDGVELRIYYDDAPHVAQECDEIADDYEAPCRGSTARFELNGTDLDLVLVNEHLLICERMKQTGDFVFFSGQNGLIFEDET